MPQKRNRSTLTKASKTVTDTRARSLRASSSAKKLAGHEKIFEKIYRLVLKIPKGRVMTYGQIARLLEDRYSPRLVGWAMHSTPHDSRNIPWHRVINSRGGISTDRVIPYAPGLQQSLLEAEGVAFDDHGHCDLGTYQWSPRIRSGQSVVIGKKPNGSKAAKKSRK